MFNPLYPFTGPLLNAFIKGGKPYFVRQTYNRGRNHLDENEKGAYLITHYSEKTTAEAHYNAIAGDFSRRLYDWNNTEDKERLRRAASAPAGYRIYAAILDKDPERRITDGIRKSIRAYVDRLGWRPARGETVMPNFYLQFGELYASLKYKSWKTEIKFEDIENQY